MMKRSDEMDAKRKKELIYEWENRCPEMGVVSFRRQRTGETFLGIRKILKAIGSFYDALVYGTCLFCFFVSKYS